MFGSVIPTFSLDELRLPPIHVLKVDVEGAEALVIQGGIKTSERDNPVIISEFSCEMIPRISGCSPESYLDLLCDRNYKVHVIEKTTGQLKIQNSLWD